MYATTIPEKIIGTGSIEVVSGACLQADYRRDIPELAASCCYCLDAPFWLPAGSTMARVTESWDVSALPVVTGR